MDKAKLNKGAIDGVLAVNETAEIKRAKAWGTRETRSALRTAAGLPRKVKGRLVMPTADDLATAEHNLNALRIMAGLQPAIVASPDAPVEPPTVVNAPAE